MRLTLETELENIECIDKKDCGLLRSLLVDTFEQFTAYPIMLEIHVQDWHNEYSAERTDPCPDYYGTYFIKWTGCNDSIVAELDINALDSALCAIGCAFEQFDEVFRQNVNERNKKI